jgi:hypothetical protein
MLKASIFFWTHCNDVYFANLYSCTSQHAYQLAKPEIKHEILVKCLAGRGLKLAEKNREGGLGWQAHYS